LRTGRILLNFNPMRTLLSIAVLTIASFYSLAQEASSISTYDFVEILDDHQEEAMYYYEMNWKAIRDLGVAEGYIDSYELHEVAASEACPFHIILITVYGDASQYEQREKNFDKLIQMNGDLKLLNELQPAEFRKVAYNADSTVHRRSARD